MWWKVKLRIVWPLLQQTRQCCLSTPQTLMQVYRLGKNAFPHDLQSVRVVIRCPKGVIWSNSNREIRPELARPDGVTAPDGYFEVNYRIVPTLQQRGESKYTVPRK